MWGTTRLGQTSTIRKFWINPERNERILIPTDISIEFKDVHKGFLLFSGYLPSKTIYNLLTFLEKLVECLYK